jgi:glycosyltransferase involved in cell wall biosynthesis
MSKPFLSVVIPAFNEEAGVVSTLERVTEYLGAQPFDWEVIVVDDGSSDRTAAVAGEWSRGRARVRVESVPHRGKGWAVRHGMLASTGQYRFMCDADLSMPIEQLGSFLDRMGEGYDLVVGSRQVAEARRFDEPWVRHAMGRLFNWSVRVLAVGGFQDTQCGFKCFRGEVADDLFRRLRTRGWAFDVEILYTAVRRGYRILEMPIEWHHRRDSKVRMGVDSIGMLVDTIKVRWRGMSSVDVHSPEPPGPGTAGSVTIVVPTYNEAESLPLLAERIFALDISDIRLIVVDDSSPDGTASVARELSAKHGGRVEVISRQRKEGLGPAYLEGFSMAVETGTDYVVQMDADLSHDPRHIPAFLEALKRVDVVVGSRYVPGGGVDPGWSLKRRMLSYYANLGIRLVTGLAVKDPTSGFKGFRASTVELIGRNRFRCRGFGFQAEVASLCQRNGLRVTQHPITFVDRMHGRSKMSLRIVLEALWCLLPLRFSRKRQV